MKKAAIVTGSTKGIGKAIVQKFLKCGYYVYINYAHDDNSASAFASELNSSGYEGNYCIIKADLSSKEQIEDFVSKLNLKEHTVHSIVLNASTNGKTRHQFGEVTYEELRMVFDINLFIPFLLLQRIAPYICDEGRIVFIASSMGLYPHTTYIPYGLTKSAEIFLTRILVKEFSSKRITVNAVAPHCIETDMFPGKRTSEHVESIRKKIAVHRFGHPEEVADVVMSLVENGYINGEVISVDGGYNYC